jgi:outer membrane protein TolC
MAMRSIRAATGGPAALVAVGLLALPFSLLGQAALTLEDALREARAANARLPLPAFDLSISRSRLSEALAAQWFKVALEGEFVYAPRDGAGYDPNLTDFGDAKLQVVARQPLYAGGALKAGVERAGAAVAAAGARYRVAEKDLELEVRSRYAELQSARAERDVRREGLSRLDTYRTLLKSRQASGQAVAADLLKSEVRASLEEVAVADAEQRAEQARIELNLLMGRDPDAPATLETLTRPAAPPEGEGEAWERVPEIAAAEAESRSASADVTIARAEKLPNLSFRADLGFWASDTRHLNADFWDRTWRDRGYSLSLVLGWPLWDRGALQARLTAAQLSLQQAQRRLEAERRDARSKWAQARSAVRHLYEQIEILSRAVPDARDSYLESESRYRGGTATALEVLDAYAAATESAVKLNELTARYRIAQAVAARWGEP